MSVTAKKRLQGCEACPARCCNGLEEAIERPTTRAEVDELKWQLHFENTKVFIRGRRWHKLALGRCRYLDEHNLCTIYERRPSQCRDHNPPDCEHYGEIFDVMFHGPEDLQKYIDKEKKRRARRRRNGGGSKNKRSR